MTQYHATLGTDSLIGADDASDEFIINPAMINLGDSMSGGSPDAVAFLDKMSVGRGGELALYSVINFQLFETIGGIEQFYLSSEGNAFAVNPMLLRTASNNQIEIFGQGAGADLVGSFGLLSTDKLIVHAGGGNDQLFGYLEYDQFFGQGGNDTIQVSDTGDDLADGGEGNDFIRAGNGDTATGGAGNDVIEAFEAATIDGGSGFDYLTTSEFYDGLSISDVEGLRVQFLQASVADILPYQRIIGVGKDPVNITFTAGGRINFSQLMQQPTSLLAGIFVDDDIRIIGGPGANQLRGGGGDDFLIGNVRGDTLEGGTGDDYVAGGSGNDVLSASTSSQVKVERDRILGGEGNDIIALSNGLVALAESGNDTFSIYLNSQGSSSAPKFNAVLDGGDGLDTAKNTDGNSILGVTFKNVEILDASRPVYQFYASIGQLMNFETIRLAPTATLYVTGAGTLDLSAKLTNTSRALDIRSHSESNVYLIGLDGDDRLIDGKGNDTLSGGRGGDTLLADIFWSKGNDLYDGGEGNDTISPFGLGDTVFGGNGDDLIKGTASRIDGGAGTDTLILFGNNLGIGTIVNIEILEFQSYFEPLVATVQQLAGFKEFSGDFDALIELPFKLSGGGTLDFTGRTLGHGVDVTIMESRFPVHLTGTAFNDTLGGSSLGDVLIGNAGRDVIQGESGNDSILGGIGDDVLIGDNEASTTIWGHDTLDGGDGDDAIVGGAGNDRLDGGAGSDRIIGGAGIDSMSGGAGADTFVFYGPNDAPLIKQASDYIGDFETGFDQLDLQNIPGLSFIGSQAFSGVGQIHAVAATDKVYVDINISGGVAPEMRIVLNGTSVPTANDFILD